MPPAPAYQQLAANLSALIHAGSFAAGARFPSIRETHRHHRISMTTAIEAYRVLESEGLIESRPRSGFFVKPPTQAAAKSNAAQRFKAKPVKIETSAIFEAVMDSSENRTMVPFAAAAPDDALILAAKIPSVTAAVFRKHKAEALRYTPPMGRRELRLALSRQLLETGLDVTAEQIVTTQGATEGLLLALRSIAAHGDLIALEAPVYFGILHIVRAVGLRVVEIPVSKQTGIDLDILEATLKKHRIKACVVQPNFQNPVGSAMTSDAKRRLAELSTRYHFTIIEDDVFGELSHHGDRPSSIAMHGGDVIHCGSISKTIAPGLRVGWLVPGKHLREVKRLKLLRSPWNTTLSELVVAECLNDGRYERHLRKLRGFFGEQCARMRDEVIRHFPSAKVQMPGGGFVLWIEMPSGFNAEAFAVDAIERGISLLPGTIFSASLRFKNCFRLSCGFAWTPRARRAIAELGRLAKRQLA